MKRRYLACSEPEFLPKAVAKIGRAEILQTPVAAEPQLMKCWRNRDEFKAQVLEWAAKLDLKPQAIYVRPMRRKWASCSTAGTLSFNDELIGMDKKLGDYVIVHELLHFQVPNHGKLWKMLMRVHLGDFEAIAARLKARDLNAGARRT